MNNNFLGEPFNPWVKTQVEVRQESLGKYSNIPSRDLQNYITKAPFVRLASSVNLTNKGPKGPLDNSVLKKLIANGIPAESITGDELAKACILQGGVVSSTGENTFSGLQSGLNDGNNLFNGAYGWGGSQERGYVPMPGITNADVTYYNNGALSKTTINIRCYSKTQFSLLDVLYLRPGYTLLLEFGWSQYLNNERELVSMDQFYTDPMSGILNGGVDQYEMYRRIDAERKEHDGNYEAVFGKISKFNWQFNSDGSYDIQVQLTSIGDVIESLKCNITNPGKPLIFTDSKNWFENTFGPEVDPTQLPPLISNANETLINRELYNIYQLAQQSTSNISLLDYTLTGYVGLDALGSAQKSKDIIYPKSLLTIPGTTTDLEENQSPQVYVKYGAFLAFLQSRILLYNKDTSIISFDMNLENLDEDENVILKVGGQFSSNPLICLIPYENVNTEEGVNFPKTNINDVISNTSWDYSPYLGRISNIMVNINYLATCLESAGKDEEGSINFLQYLKIINKGIITSLGGINKFEIKLSDDGLKLRFIENIPQRRNTPSSDEYTRFNVYGVKPGIEGSFIRNVNLTADLSNDFATMISVGAQSNSNTISANATSFSNYNAGLVDRVIEEKQSIYPKTNSEGNPKDSKITIESNFDENINPTENSLFIQIYQNLKFLNEQIKSLTSHNTTHASLILGELTNQKQIQAPFFLPFNFSLEMDGLSGMKLYQKFLMTNDILPPSYEDDGVDLQITGINHSISPQAWTTNVDTQSVPADELSGVQRPAELKSPNTTQQS